MMVLLQDARKSDFPIKFDVVWLGPYLIRETIPNNLLQLEILNEVFGIVHQAHRTSGTSLMAHRV